MKRKRRRKRYTQAGDRRGSVVKPHPNSLGAQDPSLLRLVDEDWRSLRREEQLVKRDQKFRRWEPRGKAEPPSGRTI